MSAECIAVGAQSSNGVTSKMTIPLPAMGEHDVSLDVHYCGMCHSDLHQVKGDWGSGIFPMVPGHEIAGVVTAVGAGVTKFAVGDRVGVGCMVGSCRDCRACAAGHEQYCTGESGFVGTYGTRLPDGSVTYGGYSQRMVVSEDFVVRIPDSLELDVAAPLLCAGITTFSPLAHFGARAGGEGFHVGIIGLGGLGHMGVKLARAMGCTVTVISTSPRKAERAAALGANFLVSSDADAMAAARKSMDLILDTAAGNHNIELYTPLLATDGKIVVLGIPTRPFTLHAFTTVMNRIAVTGSLIGGIAETQEMLDFCAEHGITPDIEVIPATAVNDALAQLLRNSSAVSRFVIDVRGTMVDGDWEVDAAPADYVAVAETAEADAAAPSAAAAGAAAAAEPCIFHHFDGHAMMAVAAVAGLAAGFFLARRFK